METSRLERFANILRICSKGEAPMTMPKDEAATVSTVSGDNGRSLGLTRFRRGRGSGGDESAATTLGSERLGDEVTVRGQQLVAHLLGLVGGQRGCSVRIE